MCLGLHFDLSIWDYGKSSLTMAAIGNLVDCRRMKSSNKSPEEGDNETSKMCLWRFSDRNTIYMSKVKISCTRITTNPRGLMTKSDLWIACIFQKMNLLCMIVLIKCFGSLSCKHEHYVVKLLFVFVWLYFHFFLTTVWLYIHTVFKQLSVQICRIILLLLSFSALFSDLVCNMHPKLNLNFHLERYFETCSYFLSILSLHISERGRGHWPLYLLFVWGVVLWL